MDSSTRLATYKQQRSGGILTAKQDRRYEKKRWREIREEYKTNPDQL
jgi:hypothetical protein